jgi:hypothetical protein
MNRFKSNALLIVVPLICLGCSSSTPPPPDTAERAITLALAPRSSGAVAITGVGITSSGSTPPATGTVAARAHLNGQDVVIEFTSPLPENATQLVIDSNVSLNDATDECSMEMGSYDLARLAASVAAPAQRSAVSTSPTFGSVTIPIIDNPDFEARPGHRRRRSRCVNCCPRW